MKMYLTANEPQLKRELVRWKINQSVENIQSEALRGREHKRHRKMGYYSCNWSLRRGDRKNQGRRGKNDREIIAWNFPKLKKDIKAEI